MCSAAAENQLTQRHRIIWFGEQKHDNTVQATTTFAGVVERDENLFRVTKSGGSAGGNQAIFTTRTILFRVRLGIDLFQ